MGTRADFYLGKGKEAQWLGSIAMDGYPEGIEPQILKSATAEFYTDEVKAFVSEKRDGTLPEQGWPWPWENSRTTDYSYWFFDGSVKASCFGSPFFDPSDPNHDVPEQGQNPEMPVFDTGSSAAAGSERSGLIVVQG